MEFSLFFQLIFDESRRNLNDFQTYSLIFWNFLAFHEFLFTLQLYTDSAYISVCAQILKNRSRNLSCYCCQLKQDFITSDFFQFLEDFWWVLVYFDCLVSTENCKRPKILHFLTFNHFFFLKKSFSTFDYFFD